MSWQENTVIRILLLVAKLLAKDEWRDEIKTMANHVCAGDWRAK